MRILLGKGGLAVLSGGEWLFLESLGVIFAYLSLLLIALYALTYHLFKRRLGGGDDAE